MAGMRCKKQWSTPGSVLISGVISKVRKTIRSDQYIFRGAAELDYAHGDALFYAPDERLQQEVVAPESRCGLAFRMV
jgi:hypothetical protein